MEQKNNILIDNLGKKSAETTAIEIINFLRKNTFEIEKSFDKFSKDIDNILCDLLSQNDNYNKNNAQKKRNLSIYLKLF